jgi:hypothetical protein
VSSWSTDTYASKFTPAVHGPSRTQSSSSVPSSSPLPSVSVTSDPCSFVFTWPHFTKQFWIVDCVRKDLKSTNFWDITPCIPMSVNQCHLLACCFLAELIFSTLEMEAICSSETSVDTQWTTWHYIPEVGTLHNHCCENLKSYKKRFNSSVPVMLMMMKMLNYSLLFLYLSDNHSREEEMLLYMHYQSNLSALLYYT